MNENIMNLRFSQKPKTITENDASVILYKSMCGYKYGVQITPLLRIILTVPPNNIHGFKLDICPFTNRLDTLYWAIKNGWQIIKIDNERFTKLCIMAVEQRDNTVIHILNSYLYKYFASNFDETDHTLLEMRAYLGMYLENSEFGNYENQIPISSSFIQ